MTVEEAIVYLQQMTHTQTFQLRIQIQTGPDSYKWAYVTGFEPVKLARSFAMEVIYK